VGECSSPGFRLSEGACVFDCLRLNPRKVPLSNRDLGLSVPMLAPRLRHKQGLAYLFEGLGNSMVLALPLLCTNMATYGFHAGRNGVLNVSNVAIAVDSYISVKPHRCSVH
jgi:hypothetical protein